MSPIAAMDWAADGMSLLVAEESGRLSMIAVSSWEPLWRFDLTAPRRLDMVGASVSSHAPVFAAIRGLR